MPEHARSLSHGPDGVGRTGTVDEGVAAILFTGLFPYITGKVLAIDGGLHLR
ncbi:MAG: hypothetical protein ACLQUZ_19010 [Rhizomicrobium sp.]